MNFRTFATLCIAVILFACSNVQQKEIEAHPSPIKEGVWRFSLKITDSLDLPFTVVFRDSVFKVLNGKEEIVYNKNTFKQDSIIIEDPVFNSWFEVKITNDTVIAGYWIKGKNCDACRIYFEGNYNKSRFDIAEKSNAFNGKLEVDFSPNNPDDHYKAIGLFNNGTGTFLTETGDYRFLEGFATVNEMQLSCFDGSHAFLFTANKNNDTLKGMFYSGTHWQEPWIAVRNDSFELRDPYTLTHLKEGYEKLEFTFPNADSQLVSLSDEKYKNKVVMVNIMGTWCPNCKDETAYFTELHNKYQSKGLEIIALCFEKSKDFYKNVKRIEKIKNYFGCNYEFLIAGRASKKEAAEALPMLNHIMSFPTTIFIDKKGIIRKIHTGFYGPGTGKYYDRYVEETNKLVEKLLNE